MSFKHLQAAWSIYQNDDDNDNDDSSNDRRQVEQNISYVVAKELLNLFADRFPDCTFQLIRGALYCDGGADNSVPTSDTPKICYMLWSGPVEIHIDGVDITVYKRDKRNIGSIDATVVFQYAAGKGDKFDLRYPGSLEQLISHIDIIVDKQQDAGELHGNTDSSI